MSFLRERVLNGLFAYYLEVPPCWGNSVLQPQDYILFLENIAKAQNNAISSGVLILGHLSQRNARGVHEIVDYLDNIKHTDGVGLMDTGGRFLKKNYQEYINHESVQNLGFQVQNINEENIKNLRYGLNRMALASDGNMKQIMAYTVYTPGQIENIEHIFKFLQEYGIAHYLLVLDGERNPKRFPDLLAQKTQIFKELVHLEKKSKEYGITYFACEDNFNMFSSWCDQTDIIFYRLFGSARVDLMPGGHVTILGGRQPCDAGIWTPDQNAFDLIISTLKTKEDPLLRRLTTESSLVNVPINTKFRSSILASAVMAGEIDRAGL